ncbi:FecCD family ABC transporter permease [Pseudoalteromonas luteoviolacea]|uniref:ABC transporter permease n=1 Tax=Pseudoalteromonas luteoviolacea NCIMB 1942 TaxID=1365253 RepID=A0A167D1X7_9GAMM|nr:iron ABC transporter permease [Pseudoalteromonas luteoviolacea]KZN48328.1 ABC transporter permease [Pseudoalteromonas luteoviolacea NCIMB 1942]
MRLAASSILILVCLFSFMSALSIGAIHVDFYDVWLALWSYDETQLAQKIIVELRLPRTVLAFLAGAGLATAGLILQTVTRNPLADPYLFGISSGASFGVVLLLTLFGIQNGLAMSGAALLGSVCAMSLLLLIAYHKGAAQIENMLLAGVALSFLFNAFTSLLLYWSDPQAITAIIFWSLGSFSRADWAWMWLPSSVVIIGFLSVICFRRHLNALLLGDESAVTLGVNVHRLRLGMLLVSSLLTAVLVAACGGVGFVGLMIPHIVRFFISQARVLGMLMTALSGGLLMLWVDVLARSLIDNQELPIGVITAAIGSVFFLSLLMFKKRSATI